MIQEVVKRFKFSDMEILSPSPMSGDPFDRMFDQVSDEIAEWLGLSINV